MTADIRGSAAKKPEYWHIKPKECDQRRNWCRVGCFGCELVINDVEDDGCHTCREDGAETR